ncbi:MAG: hypothetical protein JNN13_04205 [Planctomycetes bacterium]|nr:hypothetical protein [Planctomycetota bacterium]
MPARPAPLLAALLTACVATPGTSAPPADAARRLHGHNDYLQPRPLLAALELGLGSVEADVFLQHGELLVGHERWQLRAGRSLRSLYLEPLQRWVDDHGGRVHDLTPFVLLVDIKADAAAVYDALRRELAPFAGMLTRFVDGRIEPGAVTVLLSGDRPRELVAKDHDRCCALDGRLTDLGRGVPNALMPWISDQWRRVGDWDGRDDLLPAERARLDGFIAATHAEGKQLRFWGAPDRAEAWLLLHDAGVDHIGSDRPAAAVAWQRSR